MSWPSVNLGEEQSPGGTAYGTPSEVLSTWQVPSCSTRGPRKFRLLLVTVSLSLYPSALPFECQKFTWAGLPGGLSQHLAGRRGSERTAVLCPNFPRPLSFQPPLALPFRAC